jgi:hypothetical protein
VGFLDWHLPESSFNLAEYEHYEQVENGDLNWIVPGVTLTTFTALLTYEHAVMKLKDGKMVKKWRFLPIHITELRRHFIRPKSGRCRHGNCGSILIIIYACFREAASIFWAISVTVYDWHVHHAHAGGLPQILLSQGHHSRCAPEQQGAHPLTRCSEPGTCCSVV